MSNFPYIYVVLDRGTLVTAFTRKYDLVDFLDGKTLWGHHIYRVEPFSGVPTDITSEFTDQ